MSGHTFAMVATLLTCGLMLVCVLGSIRYWGPDPTRAHLIVCTVAGIIGAMAAFAVMMVFFREDLVRYNSLLSMSMVVGGVIVSIAGMLQADPTEDENEPSAN